jgi:hypothetical protein
VTPAAVRVPYLGGMLHPRVTPAILRQGYEPALALIDPDDPHAYRDLLELWVRSHARCRQDLVVIEHDVESRTGTLAEYETCPSWWCFHAYRFCLPYEECGLEGHWSPLGHTRYRWQACAALVRLFDDDAWRSIPGYHDLDRVMGQWLVAHGVVPHRHRGDVIHWHDYDTERV